MFDTKTFVQKQVKENKNLILFSDIDQSTINLSDYINVTEFDKKKSNVIFFQYLGGVYLKS